MSTGLVGPTASTATRSLDLLLEALVARLAAELLPVLRTEIRTVLADLPGNPATVTGRTDSRLLSVADVAARLGVTQPTIREWIRTGYLRATPVGPAGRKYAISESD